MFQFSLQSICLVLVLHAVIFVLVMVLQVSVTLRHQKLAHGYESMDLAGRRPTSLKCPQLHAPAAECPSRCQQTNYEIVSAICSGPLSSHWFSHSAFLSVSATHATALDIYLFWHRCSTHRGTSFHHWVARTVKMLPPKMRTAQQQCKPVLCPWLSRIFLSCRSAGFLLGSTP